MEIKIMAFREVYKLFVDAWELYRKYSARRLDDAECEAMAQEADAINEKYQSDLAKDMLRSVHLSRYVYLWASFVMFLLI